MTVERNFVTIPLLEYKNLLDDKASLNVIRRAYFQQESYNWAAVLAAVFGSRPEVRLNEARLNQEKLNEEQINETEKLNKAELQAPFNASVEVSTDIKDKLARIFAECAAGETVVVPYDEKSEGLAALVANA